MHLLGVVEIENGQETGGGGLSQDTKSGSVKSGRKKCDLHCVPRKDANVQGDRGGNFLTWKSGEQHIVI